MIVLLSQVSLWILDGAPAGSGQGPYKMRHAAGRHTSDIGCPWCESVARNNGIFMGTQCYWLQRYYGGVNPSVKPLLRTWMRFELGNGDEFRLTEDLEAHMIEPGCKLHLTRLAAHRGGGFPTWPPSALL